MLIVLSYVTRAYRWQILLRPFKKIPVKEIYSPLMIGFMGNVLPARAGEFLRAYLVGKKHNITFSGAFSTIIVERLFDLVCLLALFVWVFLFNAEIFDPNLTFSGVSVQTMHGGVWSFLLYSGLCFASLHVPACLAGSKSKILGQLVHTPSSRKMERKNIVYGR